MHGAWVILFAAAICWLASTSLLSRFNIGPASGWLIYILFGIAGGLAVTPVTFLLMALKSGLHGHGAPDFTPEQVIEVIQLTPVWVLAGFLISLGAWLLRLSRQENKP